MNKGDKGEFDYIRRCLSTLADRLKRLEVDLEATEPRERAPREWRNIQLHVSSHPDGAPHNWRSDCERERCKPIHVRIVEEL